MTNEFVSINNLKENILEFDLKVEGLSTDNLNAKFIIRSSGMDLAFPCAKDEQGKWSVKLPPLPMLERTAYPYVFSITAEGYHFEPLKGSINVVGSSDVYVSNPKNTKLASPSPTTQKVVEKKAEVKVEPIKPSKSREKSIAQIAEELMEQEKKKPVVEPKKTPKVEVSVKESLLPKIDIEPKKEAKTGDKDAAALKVLEDMGIRSKKIKPKSRFSIKD